MKGNPVSAHSLAELLADSRHQLASRVSVPYRKWPLAPGADARGAYMRQPIKSRAHRRCARRTRGLSQATTSWDGCYRQWTTVVETTAVSQVTFGSW